MLVEGWTPEDIVMLAGQMDYEENDVAPASVWLTDDQTERVINRLSDDATDDETKEIIMDVYREGLEKARLLAIDYDAAPRRFGRE